MPTVRCTEVATAVAGSSLHLFFDGVFDICELAFLCYIFPIDVEVLSSTKLAKRGFKTGHRRRQGNPCGVSPGPPQHDEADAFTGNIFLSVTNIFHFWEGIIGFWLAIVPTASSSSWPVSCT